MRRFLTIVVAVMTMGVFMAPAVGAGQDKVEVCHAEGTGEFHLIAIADPAFEAHVAHGDSVPGGPVPGVTGFVFDGTCNLVEAFEISAQAYFDGSFGIVTADERGFTYSFSSIEYTDPTINYSETLWDSYVLFLPENEAIPVAEVNLVGVPQELTVVFDVFRINLDGTVGSPVTGWSFQHSFVATEGAPIYVTTGGVDVWPRDGFPTTDDIPLLHVGVATVYHGPDTTGDLLATAERIAGLSS